MLCSKGLCFPNKHCFGTPPPCKKCKEICEFSVGPGQFDENSRQRQRSKEWTGGNKVDCLRRVDSSVDAPCLVIIQILNMYLNQLLG